jgi:hypothetical protein
MQADGVPPIPPSLKVVVFEDDDTSVPSCAYIESRHRVVAFVRRSYQESDLLSLAFPLLQFGFKLQTLKDFICNVQLCAARAV